MSLIDDRSKSRARPILPSCLACGFGLFIPVAELTVSHAGLYDDARFPGRLLVSLIAHYEHLDEVPADMAAQFMADVQRASSALRSTGPATRVNIAILGNQEPHVHAHLVPRFESDPLPGNTPWQDPRPKARLDPSEREQLVATLAARLRSGL